MTTPAEISNQSSVDLTEKHETFQKLGYFDLPSLTVWRGAAALSVAFFHGSLVWSSQLSPLASVGWLGVAFFYILSGFVLTWSAKDHASARTFYLQRIARIYPMHILCLAISIAGFLLVRNPLAGYVGTYPGTVANVFLVHGWIPEHPNIRQAWNGVSWSLSVEMFFYVVAPFLIRALLRASSNVLVSVAFVLFATHSFLGIIAFHDGSTRILDYLQYCPLCRLPEFIYGIIGAALLRRSQPTITSYLIPGALFLPLIGYCLAVPADRNPILMIDIAVPAFFALIVCGAARDITRAGHSYSTPGLFSFIGRSSYSLYMVHALILGMMQIAIGRLGFQISPVFALLTFLAISIFVAGITYGIVELPARVFLLQKFLGRRTSGQSVVSTSA